jgi:glucose/arabinose dehydrogenase
MDPATGSFEWTPAETQNGGHTVTVTVSDSNGLTDSQDVAVTVNEVNTNPVLDEIPDQTVDTSSTLTFVASATDGDRYPGVGVETVAANLQIPWSIDWIPDGAALFTERGGSLRIIRDGVLASDPLLSLSVSSGEGGLLGVAVDPDFGDNHYIYLYYSTRGTDNALINKVVRYQFANGTVTEDRVLVDGIPGAQYHDGGRIQFGPDGKLYITTGDAGRLALAQDLDSLAGKILRIDRNGAVPAGNPFANSPVWSFGHRNPQGLDWDAAGNLVATEHGPSGERGRAHDEINLILPGANYGWPNVIGGELEEGMREPILHTGSDTWAPSGAEFYDGDRIPGWTGKYFVAALRGAHLHMVDLDLPNNAVISNEKLFQDEFGRLRDVQTGPDGFLYLLTSNRDGRGSPVSTDDRILRIVPVPDADRSRPANTLTYGLDGGPGGASIDPVTGTFVWAPAGNRETGTVAFNVTVSDGRGGTDMQTVRVHVSGTITPQVPQTPRGIGEITLASTGPGVMEASWEAPTETPADYRIAWTKVGEPYLTWTDLSGNAFPTSPSQTVTDLEEGEQYKVKVRARYSSGGPGDWSGEFNVTVAGTG